MTQILDPPLVTGAASWDSAARVDDSLPGHANRLKHAGIQSPAWMKREAHAACVSNSRLRLTGGVAHGRGDTTAVDSEVAIVVATEALIGLPDLDLAIASQTGSISTSLVAAGSGKKIK